MINHLPLVADVVLHFSVYLCEAEFVVQAAAVTVIFTPLFQSRAKNLNYLLSLNLAIICPDFIFHISIPILLESGTEVPDSNQFHILTKQFFSFLIIPKN